jgi:diaminohydroxyphosphoribosylaminopyrimidine deaminase/5-amino-6-(5-phosphoribosylamino)uracil reductase
LAGDMARRMAGRVVGWGYHRSFGGPHAEIVALKRAGRSAAGATLYCTLEPCNHQGKTGPCTQAIIDARLARVVIARRDPFPPAAGGIERLRNAGIDVDLIEDCPIAAAVSEPFVHRLRSGLPWVTVKWAQTIDGKIAPRNGQSKWISSNVSRRMVHRERGRVDAILTGIGTVLADDPMLTARNVRLRRIARRVVIDPALQIPIHAKLVGTAGEFPTLVYCDQRIMSGQDQRVNRLRELNVDVRGLELTDGELPLRQVLRDLADRDAVQHVLVEAGNGVMTRLFRDGLVNVAWVFTSPMLMGDPCAPGPLGPAGSLQQRPAESMNDPQRFMLIDQRTRGGDVCARYRV